MLEVVKEEKQMHYPKICSPCMAVQFVFKETHSIDTLIQVNGSITTIIINVPDLHVIKTIH